jgi:hypothetical protein
VHCDRNARDISFRKNRIRDSLQSKVGEGVRVGRGGRSLGDRPALASARFGFEENFGATASTRAKSPASPPSL